MKQVYPKIKVGIILTLLLFHAVANADPSIRLVKPGQELTEEEIRKAESAPSIQWDSQDGYRANEEVIKASSIMTFVPPPPFEGKEPISFRAFIPKAIREGRKYPMVVWVHGAGESKDDNESQLAHLQSSIRFLVENEIFLIAVQVSEATGSWGSAIPGRTDKASPLDLLDSLIETFPKEYPVDPKRISLFGICSGAMASWELIHRHPNRYSGFVACSSAAPPPPYDDYISLPIWMMNNRLDWDVWSDNTPLMTYINNRNGDFLCSVFNKEGHDTWTNAQKEDHALEWLTRQKQGGFPFPRHVIVRNRSIGESFLFFGLPITVIILLIILHILCRTIKQYRRNYKKGILKKEFINYGTQK